MKQKKAGSAKRERPYQVRDYFAKQLADNGLTVEKFNKILGLRK